jgi:hypothetical protein
MFESNSLIPEDRQFLKQLADLFRRAVPAKSRDKTMVVAMTTGDELAIAARLEAIAEHGDSTVEMGRVVV